MIATTMIATLETDARLRASENEKGRAAAKAGLPHEACPWVGGLCEVWWMEGWTGSIIGAEAQNV
jgi:hypothetical protein